MRVVTQNYSWNLLAKPSARFKETVKTVKNYNPDVIFLQEAFFLHWLRIKLDIDGYQVYYKHGKNGIIKGGLITYLKNEYTGKVRYLSFKKQGKFFGIQAIHKIFRKGMLEVYIPKQKLYLINTHLSAVHKPHFILDKTQFAQINQILDSIKYKARVVLGGDFNFHNNSVFYTHISQPLDDATEDVLETFPGYNTKFDYIFTKGLKVNTYKSMPIPSSNLHYGMYTIKTSDHLGVISYL